MASEPTKELGLVLNHLDLTVDGESHTVFDGAEIMHYSERNLKEPIDDLLRDAERVDSVHGEIEVWAEGERQVIVKTQDGEYELYSPGNVRDIEEGEEYLDTLPFEGEDFDPDMFWHVFWAAFRAAYDGLSAHA